ncbi:C-N hydrolase [Pseudoalteromonas carrageenovora]|jgi:predicted amidohydrolase|uniref:Omega-amidase YafV n=1 Tax=Pseudoalteromonas carrageenovora IAM 12662 TaxID=1314868 RepID=A0A2K4X507_PSEVC|nr:amidohydrolase [Pseudoalteromonas carrageenovora]MBE0381494.1 carbon-nitrogen hydrolase family protein [Pseudoalteromonas carrageenovora IAM 12662]QBJ70355.1 C-N hydrolase [Pseudoalteromonas carrageenovora]GEB72821.1 amidohydrolase [Pseudoalteromonas carrageenovora]SOU39410.1 Hydrolase YafV [Pseudoalteromonas carrageenovora IAM 12662]
MSTLTLTLVQSELHWLDKDANLAMFDKKLAEITANPDLILLPETFATGFAINLDCAEPENGKVLTWLKTQAHKHNAVIAGSVLVAQGDKKANRFYWVTPKGEVNYYDKRHLFRLGSEGDYVVAGQARKTFEINGFKLLPQVCYDLRFPVFQRNNNDYDVMINVANWPAVRRHIWDTLLMARAMENLCYVVAVNRVGDDGNGVAHNGGTAVFDFKGDTLAKAKDNTQELLTLTLDKAPLEDFKTAFPAYLDADPFTLT